MVNDVVYSNLNIIFCNVVFYYVIVAKISFLFFCFINNESGDELVIVNVSVDDIVLDEVIGNIIIGKAMFGDVNF